MLLTKKGRGKEDSRGCSAGKARKDTRSVATGISLQRGSGASQRKCGFDVAPQICVVASCNEERQLGSIQRKMQERRKVIGVGPRKNTRSSEEKWQRMKLDIWALCRKF